MSERDPHLGEPFDDAPSSAAPTGAPAEQDPAGSPAVGQEPAGAVSPASDPAPSGAAHRTHEVTPNMLPGRRSRGTVLERGVVRLVATGGVIGIGVGIAAILASQHVQGWIIGLVVATLSVILSAVLWSSRQL
ncbi:MAG TPA: hypothetical protein VFN55_15845 [Solirubrobacteraceae bacterium]|nr:hypothetical protein [Solirubrobacteraceae bacterium]